MTALEIFEAREEKQRRIALSRGICEVCKKHCGDTPQLAHIIPKGYVRIYGKAVMSHPKIFKLVWSAKCNDAALRDPKTHPLEAERLIKKIRKELSNENKSNYI